MIEEGGGRGGGFDTSYAEVLAAGGWQSTSSTRTNDSYNHANWSYSGSGSYSRTARKLVWC